MKFVSYIFFGILLVGCQSPQQNKGSLSNLEEFYIPWKSLGKGKIYVYKSLNDDRMPNETWSFTSVEKDGKKFIQAKFLNPSNIMGQESLDEILPEGIINRSLTIYDKTGANPQSAAIASGVLFPFSIKDTSAIFLYRVNWKDPDDTTQNYTLIKNRKFLGFNKADFKSTKIDILDVESKEALESNAQGTLSIEYKAHEKYAKGIGLFYYKKEFKKDFIKEYILDTIIDL